MGASKPWPEAMKAITGQDRMDASAFREYFKPLENWLIAKNKELEEPVGWSTGQCLIELSTILLVLVSIDLVFDVPEGGNCQRDPPHLKTPMEESRPTCGQTI